jgi:hypothetical protein
MQKINYERLTNNALQNCIKEILSTVSKDGLYKKQHFIITFSTRHPSIKMSQTLLDDYDQEMTIALQHEFWNLKIDSAGFSVGLSFDTCGEEIYVPFASIVRFCDPSENFVLDLVPDFSVAPPPAKNIDKENRSAGNVVSFDAFRKSK